MATPFKSGSEFLVNTLTTGGQWSPSTTGLADGRFLVSWENYGTTAGDATPASISVQIFNADGSKAGGEFQANTITDSGQISTATAALSDGRFVVSWTDLSASSVDTSLAAVRAQVYNADGSKSGAEFLVNTTTANNQLIPTITGLENGRFVVSWESHDGIGNSAVMVQVYNANGTRSGGETRVTSAAFPDQSNPTITGLSNGRFVVSWVDASKSLPGAPDAEIHAQVFNANGTKRGGEFTVNTTAADNQLAPAITALTNGRFVVSWADSSGSVDDPSLSAVRAQVFNANGAKRGGEFLVNTTTASNQIAPTITGLADGRFVVSWLDNSASGLDTSLSAIRAQVFNLDGSKSGGEFLVNTTTASLQIAPSVSTLADGRFVVSWQDFSQTGGDTSDSAIRAQIFDPREAAVTLTGTGLSDQYVGTGFGDTMAGKAGNDTLSGLDGRDKLTGDKGNDTLRGDAGRDVLGGGDGRDKVYGGTGNDVVKGGKGNDKLFGGAGKDKLTGARGQDDQTGGAGADRFIFNAVSDTGKTAATRDSITDFSQFDGDRIDLSGIDAKSGPGNQAFSFVGTAAFSSTAGELRFRQKAGETIVQGDVDGDGVKDFEIALDGLITLTAGDFIL